MDPVSHQARSLMARTMTPTTMLPAAILVAFVMALLVGVLRLLYRMPPAPATAGMDTQMARLVGRAMR